MTNQYTDKAGDFLKQYETSRYTWLQRKLRFLDAIISPSDAETFGDVSFYQAGMNWDLYATKARAAIIRIGQNVWKDSEFETNYREARRVGVALGGYWFFDGRATPGQQADIIIASMTGKQFELELFIDWEKNYGGQYEGLPNVVLLMQRLEAAGVKCKAVGLYTGYYFFGSNSNASVNASQYTWLKGHPLWLAWYAAASVVKIPAPWVDYTHWQYGTPVINMGQPTAEIDMNKSRYGKAEFAARYLGTSPTPPPDGGNMANGTAKEALGKTSTIRTSPGVVTNNSTDLTVGPGQTIEFVEIVTGINSASDKWFKLPSGNYVQYIYAGRTYYTILTQPSTPPLPAPTGSIFDVVLTEKDAAGTVTAVYKGTLTKQ